MIKINRVIPPIIQLYSPQGELIGDILNEHEASEIRIQIAQKELEGYYFMRLNRKGEKVKSNISPAGDVDVMLTQWELIVNYLHNLIMIKRKLNI